MQSRSWEYINKKLSFLHKVLISHPIDLSNSVPHNGPRAFFYEPVFPLIWFLSFFWHRNSDKNFTAAATRIIYTSVIEIRSLKGKKSNEEAHLRKCSDYRFWPLFKVASCYIFVCSSARALILQKHSSMATVFTFQPDFEAMACREVDYLNMHVYMEKKPNGPRLWKFSYRFHCKY